MMSNANSDPVATVLCRNCRMACDENFNFCARCGERLRSSGTTITADELYAPVKIRRIRYLVLAAFLCLLLIGGSVLVTSGVIRSATSATTKSQVASVTQPEGIAWFYDLHGQSDAIALSLNHLPPSAKGKTYTAWLVNPFRPHQWLRINSLLLDRQGNATFLSEQTPTFNNTAQNLRVVFTQVLVTLEDAAAIPQHPGQSVLRGMISEKVLAGITPLFVSASYTPGQQALLAAFQSQTRELGRWMTNLLDAAQGNNMPNVHADLLRMLYVLEGARGNDVLHLNIQKQAGINNAGDGYGLLSSSANCQSSCGYIAALRLALQQNALPQQSSLFTILSNLEQRTQVLQQQALHLSTISTLNASTRSELAVLSRQVDALLNGIDLDGDAHIDAVPGEAGVAQFFAAVQQVGAIRLQAV